MKELTKKLHQQFQKTLQATPVTSIADDCTAFSLAESVQKHSDAWLANTLTINQLSVSVTTTNSTTQLSLVADAILDGEYTMIRIASANFISSPAVWGIARSISDAITQQNINV